MATAQRGDGYENGKGIPHAESFEAGTAATRADGGRFTGAPSLTKRTEGHMIKEIAFTAYPAADVGKLRKWYEDTLGLKFSGPYVEEGVEKYNEANIGGGYFSLMTHEWIERDPGSASGVVFEVDDIDKTVADLRGKGVEIDDPYATPVCKIASFDDPEGNKVSLHQVTV
jgi:predicted enzyme related to lactoylglutathione lyase